MSNQPNLSNVVIAGASSGYKVVANHSTHAIFQNLESMAGLGNHWAQIAVKEICSLQSGAIKNNVYVSSFETKNQLEKLTLFLPGCKVHVLKRSDGSFFVHHVEMSTEYQESLATETASGLYDVRKQADRWQVEFLPDGEIEERKDTMPVVMISDGGENPREAAIDCANHGSNAPIGGGSYVLDKKGFNMHFTNGTKIGGVRNIGQALSPTTYGQLHTSALLLANTMLKSKARDDVCWITQAGGSGVFTQALKILKNKGAKFEGSGHTVFFSHLTTNLKQAETLSRELGFEFKREVYSVNKLNLNELIGGLQFGGDITSAIFRKKHDPKYTALQLGADLSKSVDSNWKAITTFGAATAAISATIGSGGTAAALPASLAIASAVYGTGKTLFKAWLPERYRRLASKL